MNRDIDRIQAILESTTQKLYPKESLLRKGKLCGDDTYTSHPNNYFGYGRVDVWKAVETCREFCKQKKYNSNGGKLPLLESSIGFKSSSLLKSKN